MKLALLKRVLTPRAATAVLALILVASVVAGREKRSAEPVEPAARIAATVQVDDLDLERLARTAGPAPLADPFAQGSLAAAGANGAAAAPAKPSAPPLPFKYLGKAIEDGKLSVFLARDEDSFSVHGGQKLDAEYRVDKVSETAVTFTYLPMKTKQTLDIPAVN
jgi:hypothetical protein